MSFTRYLAQEPVQFEKSCYEQLDTLASMELEKLMIPIDPVQILIFPRQNLILWGGLTLTPDMTEFPVADNESSSGLLFGPGKDPAIRAKYTNPFSEEARAEWQERVQSVVYSREDFFRFLHEGINYKRYATFVFSEPME